MKSCQNVIAMTLIEMLISLAIFSIAALGLSSLIADTMKMNAKTIAKSDLHQESKAFFDLLDVVISNAVEIKSCGTTKCNFGVVNLDTDKTVFEFNTEIADDLNTFKNCDPSGATGATCEYGEKKTLTLYYELGKKLLSLQENNKNLISVKGVTELKLGFMPQNTRVNATMTNTNAVHSDTGTLGIDITHFKIEIKVKALDRFFQELTQDLESYSMVLNIPLKNMINQGVHFARPRTYSHCVTQGTSSSGNCCSGYSIWNGSTHQCIDKSICKLVGELSTSIGSASSGVNFASDCCSHLSNGSNQCI